MCRKLTILARDDTGHAVAQCEHGTIHLFWVRAAIFLHPDDLLTLLALLPRWQPGHAVLEADGFKMVRQETGLIQLWCDDAGLQMSVAEAYGLARLIVQAVGRLDLLSDDGSPLANPGHGMYRPLTGASVRPGSPN